MLLYFTARVYVNFSDTAPLFCYSLLFNPALHLTYKAISG